MNGIAKPSLDRETSASHAMLAVADVRAGVIAGEAGLLPTGIVGARAVGAGCAELVSPPEAPVLRAVPFPRMGQIGSLLDG